MLGALGVLRVMRSMLYGTSPTDAAALGAAVFIIVVVAVGAAYLPAQRATRVDPILSLRGE